MSGLKRHPSFKELRLDKKVKDVIKVIAEPKKMIEKKPVKKEKDTVKLTHPEKVLYKEDGITKQDLFDYYQQISTYILPFISHRPLTLVRCPSEYQDCFYQKKINDASAPDLHPIAIKSIEGNKSENYIYLENENGLLQLVQMSVLEIHPWGSLIEALEYPDMITIDLDPAPDVPWSSVVTAAFDVKKRFTELNLKSFVKTTGGKGLHVVVPITPNHNWEQIKEFTHAFVEVLEKMSPDRYVTVMSKAKRKGKIFMDYLRNQRGATAIAAYSTRARIHAPVSTPLDWDELTDDLNDMYFTIKTLPARLEKLKKDPWGNFWDVQQSLKLNK